MAVPLIIFVGNCQNNPQISVVFFLTNNLKPPVLMSLFLMLAISSSTPKDDQQTVQCAFPSCLCVHARARVVAVVVRGACRC